MRRILFSVAIAIAVAGFVASAHAPSGAIFTSLPDGSAVNYNIYAQKPDVYLDGGPGNQAPIWAAGLTDGRYVFQITDPSGKVLLSVDPARCREFDVVGGIITAVVPAGGCEHKTGIDKDHGAEGAVTVQMCGGGLADERNPTACFLDTPNPGGEYKAWVTMEVDFLDGCALLGVSNGLDVVDCGGKTRGNAHGFVPRHSKTDNFKVGGNPREIDTRFWDGGSTPLDGMKITWTDTLGGSNVKWSYYAPALDVNHEAHVEAVENGTHYITIDNQQGCMVGAVYLAGKKLAKTGPQTVPVFVRSSWLGDTIFVDVYCK